MKKIPLFFVPFLIVGMILFGGCGKELNIAEFNNAPRGISISDTVYVKEGEDWKDVIFSPFKSVTSPFGAISPPKFEIETANLDVPSPIQ